MNKIKLYTCVNKGCDYIGFNQIITEWESNNFIERVHIPMLPDNRFCAWVGRVGGLVIEPSNAKSVSTPYEYVLCNHYRDGEWENDPKILPLTLFVRDWNSYREIQSQLPAKRINKSIFSGTIRFNNRRSPQKRHLWIDSTEIFTWRRARGYNSTNYKYPTLKDYYKALSDTRFGLCPGGDTCKCQREIETMGLGCIPIFTPGVGNTYFEKVVEGTHYLYAGTPEEMNKKIDTISEEQEKFMREEGIKFFNKHCTPVGIWNDILTTIEKYNIKVD